MNRRRDEALEKCYYKPGACPTWGGSDYDITVIETVYGKGESFGCYYEKPWSGYRPGE
jgi:hypothetical protein